MSAVVLDAGAFVAVERGDRDVATLLEVARREGLGLRTTGAVVAQVWRDASGRQVTLARLLAAVDVAAVDERLGREGGALLGRAALADAVDATLVAAARSGDRIVTSDPGDIAALVAAAGRPVVVAAC